MRVTEDFPMDLVGEWLAQYRELLEQAPELAARLRGRAEDFVLVPVPRSLFDQLRPTTPENSKTTERRRTLPVAAVTEGAR